MVTYGVNYPFRRRIEWVRLSVAIIGVVFKCQVFLWDFDAIFLRNRSRISSSLPYAGKAATFMVEGTAKSYWQESQENQRRSNAERL